jgi:hypothetical protein
VVEAEVNANLHLAQSCHRCCATPPATGQHVIFPALAAGAGNIYPRAIQAELKRPLLLPASVVCVTRDSNAKAAGHGMPDWPPWFRHSMEFTIHRAAVNPDKPSITGQLLWGAQQPKM